MAVNLFVLVVYVSVCIARDFSLYDTAFAGIYTFHARNDGVKALGILAHNHTSQYTWALVRGFLLMLLGLGFGISVFVKRLYISTVRGLKRMNIERVNKMDTNATESWP